MADDLRQGCQRIGDLGAGHAERGSVARQIKCFPLFLHMLPGQIISCMAGDADREGAQGSAVAFAEHMAEIEFSVIMGELFG